jgi:DNA-binding LacI/PurR family transcriptional regulator
VQPATWREIAAELSGRIESGELPPGARIPSEVEISERWNVSRHTANRAMNELQNLGLVTRQRRWGTVVAGPQSHTPTRTIGYMVDFASSQFQADILMHVEHALDPDTRLVIATSKNNPDREAENLQRLQGQVDGMICYPVDGDTNAEAFLRLAESGFPLVLMDRAPRGCEHLVVLTDNVQASESAVTNLIDRGHERIAFFGSTDDRAQSVRERYAGYQNAVADMGFSTRPYERWIPLELEGSHERTFQAISDAFIAMRVSPNPPTAAFCVQDWLAIGLLEACATLGLTIGDDFDIATYNDFGPMSLRQPWRLGRVLQQVDQLSVVAVERLKALIAGESISPGPVRIPAQFIPAVGAPARGPSETALTASSRS